MQTSSSHRANGWTVKRGPRNYEARWLDADGRRKAKTGFARKTDAEAFSKAKTAEVRRIRSGEIVADRPASVDDLCDTFLSLWSRGIGAKGGKAPDPATVRKIRQQLKHARSRFGSRNPETLRRVDVEAWRLELSEGVRHDVTRAIKQVFAWGVKQGFLTRDATHGIENPRRPRDERKDVFPFETWDDLEAIAAELDPRYASIPIVAAGTGLRPEELFGLHRADVDRERRVLHVRRRFTGGQVKAGTKTGAQRVVPFGERVLAALDAMPPRIDTPVLFPAPRGGHIGIERWRHREWSPALRAAGIPHRRIYDLRHSYASWSLAAGVPIAKLALMMGTSVAQLESTYHRFLRADEDRYGTALDDYGKAVGQ